MNLVTVRWGTRTSTGSGPLMNGPGVYRQRVAYPLQRVAVDRRRGACSKTDGGTDQADS